MRSALLSRRKTIENVPTLRASGLRGGVLYYDGQFDDARLLINMAQTAADQGAVLLNYVKVSDVLTNAGGQVDGVVARMARELADDPEDVTVIATGGLAPLVLKESTVIDEHEPWLTLLGLGLVFERNT